MRIISTVLLIISVFNIILKIDAQTCDYGFYSDGDACKECGLTSSFRIVNGRNAIKGAFPSVVRITFNGALCTGTLISERTVLTAAHCIKGNASDYQVSYGVNDLNEEGYVTATVEKTINHEDYNDKSLLNDIALIILANKITLGPYVGVACLPNFVETFPSSYDIPVVAAGWGLAGLASEPDKLTPAEVLQTANMKIYDPEVQCQFRKLQSSQLCAGDIVGKESSCGGDSGGPLFITPSVNGKTRQVVVGLNSYRSKSNCGDKPSIKTNVKPFYDWIIKNMVY